jgi:hypothetical protein
MATVAQLVLRQQGKDVTLGNHAGGIHRVCEVVHLLLRCYRDRRGAECIFLR